MDVIEEEEGRSRIPKSCAVVPSVGGSTPEEELSRSRISESLAVVASSDSPKRRVGIGQITRILCSGTIIRLSKRRVNLGEGGIGPL